MKAMVPSQLVTVPMLGIYGAVPFVAAYLASRTTRSIENLIFDVALSTVPMLMLAAIGWRLVWPRWKLFAKILIHPCIYLVLSIYIHHWSVFVAWMHQGVLGLGGHIWFSRRHGFKWYAVEDVERYIHLSKRAVGFETARKE